MGQVFVVTCKMQEGYMPGPTGIPYLHGLYGIYGSIELARDAIKTVYEQHKAEIIGARPDCEISEITKINGTIVEDAYAYRIGAKYNPIAYTQYLFFIDLLTINR